MVYESATKFPSKEEEVRICPPPLSTYGFQKLACEYYAQGAHEQYGLPYTVIRPFNCVGIGEKRALCDKDIFSGNVKLAMSHVVPDLVQKILKGQDPLHILGAGNQIRHYTYAGDLAEGICCCIENSKAINESFNLSTPISTSVLELAEAIWKRIKPNVPFRYTSDKPFKYDVQKRVPDVAKAKKILNFEAKTTLDVILDEVTPWIEEQIKIGGI
jgi:nucleoside-diphosphate-sugar epimerase